MTDILIRGMEIPRQGLKVVAIHSNGHVYADTSDPGFLNKIADVIELPEHGDLVDADELRAVAYERGKEHQCVAFVDPLDITLAPVIVPSNKEESE